ncbi:hypothetical protein McanCB56680_006507 [Microsporum canis]
MAVEDRGGQHRYALGRGLERLSFSKSKSSVDGLSVALHMLSQSALLPAHGRLDATVKPIPAYEGSQVHRVAVLAYFEISWNGGRAL